MGSVSYRPNFYRNLPVQIPMGCASYNPNSYRNFHGHFISLKLMFLGLHYLWTTTVLHITNQK